MDENAIFTSNHSQPESWSQSRVIPAGEFSQPREVNNNPVPNAPSQPTIPPPPAETSSLPFSLFTVIKAIGVVVVIIAVVLGVFRFILPRFQPTIDEEVTLTYWGLFESEAIVNTVITDFERQHPKIKINYQKQDVKDYRERLQTRIQNGTGPDIFRYHNTWLPMLSSILVPLPNEVIQKEEFQKNYYPVIRNDVVKNGAIYGIPLEIDVLALFINTDIFKSSGMEVPKTWEEINNVSRKLTVKDESGKIKTAGLAMGVYDNVTHAPDIISLLFVQNGVDFKNIQSTAKNASVALTFYTSFAKDEANVWDSTLDPSILAFAKGNLAMYFGYSWDIFTIKSINSNLAFQVYPVPHLPGRNLTIASYWVEGVSAKSKHQKAALEFLQFLTKKETVQKLFSDQSKTRLFGEPYARIDLADSLKENAYIYPFVRQAPEAVSSYFVSDTYDNGLNTKANGYLGNAVRSILINTSSDTAVETLAQGIAQILNQYGQ